MLLGFLAGGQLGDLRSTLEWASRNGFDAVSITTRPGSRFFNVDEVLENPGWVRALVEETGVTISAIGFYGNMIDPELGRRKANQEFFRRLMEAAYRLELPVVTGWIGMMPGVGIDENLSVYAAEWPSLVKYAEDRGLKIAIENCPGNIAYRPDVWRRMFELIPSEALGLEFDPSHLICQLIDPVWAADEFGDRIYHTHMKDAEIRWDRLRRYGVTAPGWHPHRLPGFGDLDWPAFITVLRKHGYDYALSIEHEDPYFGFKEGLLLAKNFLSRFLPREK